MYIHTLTQYTRFCVCQCFSDKVTQIRICKFLVLWHGYQLKVSPNQQLVPTLLHHWYVNFCLPTNLGLCACSFKRFTATPSFASVSVFIGEPIYLLE